MIALLAELTGIRLQNDSASFLPPTCKQSLFSCSADMFTITIWFLVLSVPRMRENPTHYFCLEVWKRCYGEFLLNSSCRLVIVISISLPPLRSRYIILSFSDTENCTFQKRNSESIFRSKGLDGNQNRLNLNRDACSLGEISPIL